MLELGLGQLRDAGPVQLMGLRQSEVFGNHPLGNRQARGDCLMGELVEQFESELSRLGSPVTSLALKFVAMLRFMPPKY